MDEYGWEIMRVILGRKCRSSSTLQGLIFRALPGGYLVDLARQFPALRYLCSINGSAAPLAARLLDRAPELIAWTIRASQIARYDVCRDRDRHLHVHACRAIHAVDYSGYKLETLSIDPGAVTNESFVSRPPSVTALGLPCDVSTPTLVAALDRLPQLRHLTLIGNGQDSEIVEYCWTRGIVLDAERFRNVVEAFARSIDAW